MAPHRNFMEPLPVHPKVQQNTCGKGVANPIMDIAPFMTGEPKEGAATPATAWREPINEEESCSRHEAEAEIQQVIEATIDNKLHNRNYKTY
jgi:hypothetical protein